jgi:hypothetical protein
MRTFWPIALRSRLAVKAGSGGAFTEKVSSVASSAFFTCLIWSASLRRFSQYSGEMS